MPTKCPQCQQPLEEKAAGECPACGTALATAAPRAATATAVLAGGCFWCVEAAFEQLSGVSDVTSGYAGGSAETANYKRVCQGDTGHAEVVRITFDPDRISYDQLLTVFFDAHDPTHLNRQGGDFGTQYRSAIFYASEEEKRAAAAKIQALNEAKVFPRPIVTTLEPLREFFPAEDYHQDYARRNPNQPYVQAAALPHACKIREQHPHLIADENPPAPATAERRPPNL